MFSAFTDVDYQNNACLKPTWGRVETKAGFGETRLFHVVFVCSANMFFAAIPRPFLFPPFSCASFSAQSNRGRIDSYKCFS